MGQARGVPRTRSSGSTGRSGATPTVAIAELPLDAPAFVDWWPAERQHTTFGHLLARMLAETAAARRARRDILRETIDGQGGRDRDAIGDAGLVGDLRGHDPVRRRHLPLKTVFLGRRVGQSLRRRLARRAQLLAQPGRDQLEQLVLLQTAGRAG